jgi:hypothetical protein
MRDSTRDHVPITDVQAERMSDGPPSDTVLCLLDCGVLVRIASEVLSTADAQL